MITPSLRVALMLEDSAEADLIGDWLKDDGHSPSSYCGAIALISSLRKNPFDVVFADWSPVGMATSLLLEEANGPVGSQFALVFASSLRTEAPIVRALKGGAAGYITRPFGRRELLARLEAIVRRARLRTREGRERIIECAGLKVDCIGREIWSGGRSIQLTAKDFDLGLFFLENVGRVLLRGDILRAVWGLRVPLASRTLDTHVHRVRSRLGLTPQYGWRLSAIYGYGYRLDRLTEDCGVHPLRRIAGSTPVAASTLRAGTGSAAPSSSQSPRL